MRLTVAVLLAFVWLWACTIIGVEILPDHSAYELLMVYTALAGAAVIVWAGLKGEGR